jgi:membrane protease YdiL (CAAX protease family)
MDSPTLTTPVRIAVATICQFMQERPAIVIGSTFILIMIWGYHGELELLSKVWPEYVGAGRGWSPADSMRLLPPSRPQVIAGVKWDHELISFLAGAFLLVVVPILIIRLGFREKLYEYGLGMPPRGFRKHALVGFLALMLVSIGPFYLGTLDSGLPNSMQYVYPFYRPFDSVGEFLIYELTYIPFFIAIEFIFRGYLLFGLSGIARSRESIVDDGTNGRYRFGRYALLIQMLSYTAWHLGKPIPELWGTLAWGLLAGSIALSSRSIWPVTLAHFLLNVLLDGLVLHHLGIWPS